jgi:F0F1-type ATP synthase assembly protein I
VTAQLLATLVAALVCGVVWNPENAVAALLGGACVLLPAGYLAWRVRRERSPQKLLVMGVGKFVTTCALLVVVMVTIQPSPISFFSALFVAQLMYVLVPLVTGLKSRDQLQR